MASPFMNGSGAKDVAMDVADVNAVPARGDDESFAGRVYHDEHFAHGMLITQAGAAGTVNIALDQVGMGPGPRVTDAGTATVAIANAGRKGSVTTEVQRQITTVTVNGNIATTSVAPPVTLGMPMPKWPAGHQSAAFEAVAMKKSFILSPAEIYAECAHHGEEKAKFPWYKIWLLSMVAGCYVGFGFTVCLLIGGNLTFAPGIGSDEDTNYGLFKLVFGAVGFPFGFTTIVVCGAELYTSLCAYMTAAWWEGKVSLWTVLRMLAISWWGNFIGCVFMAGMFCAAEIYDHKDTTLKLMARDKVSHPWGATIVKGIFANWLVGIATWMANAAQDLTGKAVGIWLPISAFAMVGFEHCIANQFLFPMAWFQGGHITAEEFIWRNLIPATIGNYIGGGICIATLYAFVYGRTPKRIGAWWNSKYGKQM